MSIKVLESDSFISYPYLVLSDIHLHNWSQFSHTEKDGTNSRLQQILDAISAAVAHLAEIGGRDVVITGDLFHTRGNVKPSVLNPAFDLFREICAHNIRIHNIPGNHDLEGINSDRLGNSFTVLSGIDNFKIYVEPTVLSGRHLFIPWYEDSQIIPKIANQKVIEYPNLTLFAHVGLNGVVPARIGNTVNPKDFSEDFKYVFCGHFHNHVSFDSRVFSVGALTHQTWSDVGSKAGYLIVYENRVEHYETKAPKFIEIPEDCFGIGNVKNCYVRFKGEDTEESALDLKESLLAAGALAVLDQTTRPTLVDKSYEKTIDMDLGLDTALEAYCKNMFGDNWKAVYEECLKLKS
jgi:DNA repair exonuclease SbcCD nuclease subunit